MMSNKGKPTLKKGVGRVKDFGRSSAKNKSVEVAEVTPKDSQSAYSFIKISDNALLLPRYTDILGRSGEEGVAMDDVDTLQGELETLLCAVAVRIRTVQEEIQVLNNATEDRQDKRVKISPLGPVKRVRFQEKMVKKFKDATGKVAGESHQPNVSNKFMKTKGLPAVAPNSYIPEHEMADQLRNEAPKILPPKNDTCNKLWTFIEPYCADITPDDGKLLETLIEENTNNTEYYEIPSLGHHYSSRWAEEDNIDERTGKNELSNSVKSSEKSNETVTTGPLTHRLISAFMEENFAPVDIVCKTDENRASQLLKNLSVNNSSTLERRVIKELEEQGILNMNDLGHDEESDEILQELQRCQSELKYITSHNVQHLERLLKLVNTELSRQDLKKRLQQIDTEVIGMHREITAARKSDKVLTKKEVDRYWKALKDREILLQQIDSLHSI